MLGILIYVNVFCLCQSDADSSEYGRVCEDRNNVVSFLNDWYRLLSPAVLRESSKHFNCSDIGGPLEGTIGVSI